MLEDEENDESENIKKGYDDEESYILNIRKNDLISKLNKISEGLKRKENIDIFLEDKITENYQYSGDEIEKNLNISFLRIIIKVLGPIFVGIHLIGIFQINGLMNAVKAEIYKAIKLKLLGSLKLINSKSFIEKYHELSDTVPSFSLFFLSSFFSGLIFNLLGYYWLIIIVLVLNTLNIIFGINNFDFDIFKVNGNDYNNYSLMQFLFLVFIFLVFYLAIGISALLPLELVQKGFLKYDAYKQKKEERILKNEEQLRSKTIELKTNYNINSDESIIVKDVKKEKIEFKIKGYFLFYLLSMTGSLIIKMIVNNYFLDVYENNSKNNLYFALIYAIPTISSLPFYYFFSSVFKKDIKKNIQRNAMKIGGYIIYSESKNVDISCCKSCGLCCKKTFKQINYGCCCYLCSLTYIFKCIFCCKFYEYPFYKIEKNGNSEIINKNEKICIIYKVNSFWFWFFDKIFNIHVFPFVPIIYLFEAYNIGFKSNLSDKKIDNKKELLIRNITSLLSLFIMYAINKYGGLLLNKYLNWFSEISDKDSDVGDDYKNDFKNIISGIFPLILFETIYSAIISPLIYFKKLNNDIIQYFISFSIGSSEYLKIVCLNYLSLYWKINNNEIELLSSSFTFSFYLIIWNGIAFLIEIFINDLILFQFIIAAIIIFFFISLLIILYFCC